jgi:hypothetical protein
VTTDGVTVVLVSPHVGTNTPHPGDTDICWQSVAGGIRQCLDMAGTESQPSVSGRAIVFESRHDFVTDLRDLYLLDTATLSLTRLTAGSPNVEAELPDVSTNGTAVEVTWTSRLAPDFYQQERDVYRMAVTLPSLVVSAADLLQQLIDTVAADNLRKGIVNSLDSKLANAQAALASAHAGNFANACGMLSAFINEVQAQSGKAITTQQATELVSLANQVRAAIGCSP